MADPISPFTPDMQAQIQQLIGLQTDRSARTAPIHQAAMAMAQHMAPGYAQGAMTAPSTVGPIGSQGGGITPSVNSGGGPGAATTTAALFMAALLKNGGNNPLALGLKKLIGGGGAADPTFGGLIQGNKPLPGGTGFPDVPVTGNPSSSGMSSGIPGYFQNPNGDLVGIGGDPSNSGGYGGGLFPVNGDPRYD